MCFEMLSETFGSFISEKQVKFCLKNGQKVLTFSICWQKLGILIIRDSKKKCRIGWEKTKLHRGIFKNDKATSKGVYVDPRSYMCVAIAVMYVLVFFFLLFWLFL